MESPKARIVIKENPLYDNSDSASSKSKKEAYLDVMFVMMADITVEAAMTEMERKINLLMKVVEERDHEIIAMREQMRTCEIDQSSQTPVVKATDKGKNVVQLQDMTANSIRAQYGGLPQTTFMSTKSYTKRIDNLRMPPGKFVQSLKGNAFEWYTDLEPEVIDSWEQLEKEFLNRFYSTKRTVSMMELTNTKQRKGEPVIDYINRWRALSLDCKDRLTELSAVEMCTQGMHYKNESIASRGTKDFPVLEVRKDKETKSAEKVVKSIVKESMVVNTTPLSSLKEKKEELKIRMMEARDDLIQLPECKQPEQAGKAREKKIELDLEEVAQTNHAATMIMSEALLPRLIFEQRKSLVQFRTFEPIVVQFHQEVAPEDSQEKERSIEEDDEGWTVVTRRKKRKSTPIPKESRFYRNYIRGNKAQKNKKKKKTRKLKLVHEVDKDFPRTQRLVTLAEFFPTRFLCDHQDENPELLHVMLLMQQRKKASR
ncbi:retrotransposon gag protein [Cucumis melo var. makuwa]|uniref:Retrotransposon gag protein n=1 Tax=Cucumis melo var. makuwa TaxID=1194695 RepID=A0A5D3DSL4_CUCMM|nr:retrotransposon gag protein [Cucumis melo var. makuwa]